MQVLVGNLAHLGVFSGPKPNDGLQNEAHPTTRSGLIVLKVLSGRPVHRGVGGPVWPRGRST